MKLRGWVGVIVAMPALNAPLGAQELRVHPWPAEHLVLGPQTQSANPAAEIATATAMSAALPGSGQLHMGQSRGWLYVALETAGWLAWVNRRSAGADARAAYRDFAWNVGRIRTVGRIDGDFDYYETMSNWDRSGGFDVDAGREGIQPETDSGTFNGAIWALATRLFPDSPGGGDGEPRAEALEYYAARAYGPDLAWDWTVAPAGARTDFGGLIEESDAKYRQATNLLGLVIANHVVSAVDAFISARTRAHLELDARVVGAEARWGILLTVPTR